MIERRADARRRYGHKSSNERRPSVPPTHDRPLWVGVRRSLSARSSRSLAALNSRCRSTIARIPLVDEMIQ